MSQPPRPHPSTVETLRVLVSTCEAASAGLEAAAALVSDQAALGPILAEHAARHLTLCRQLERLIDELGGGPATPAGKRAPLQSADGVLLEACREVEARAESAYRMALALTGEGAVRDALGEQFDEVRRLSEDIEAVDALPIWDAVHS